MILSRDEVGKLWWNDVNFFTNEYDSAIGLRLVNNSSNLNRNTNSHSPDNTTSGELPIYPRNRNTQMEWSCSCLRFWKIDLEKLNGIDKWYEKLLSKLKRIDKEKKEALVKILIQRIEETKTLLQKRYEESGVMFIKNGKKNLLHKQYSIALK